MSGSLINIGSIGTVAVLVLVALTLLSIWSWTVIFKKYFLIKEIIKQENIVKRFIRQGGKISDIASYSSQLQYSPTAIFFSKANQNKQLYIEETRTELSKGLTLLASIGANAPFIGLFGTVVGIMNAFSKIGSSGSTNITVIAPGISEALITTAAGLFVAIPAVFAYNLIKNRINDIMLGVEAVLKSLE